MLTVIAGGMFAEKSTELQRRGKRLERAGKKVGYFKPDFDNRYSEDEIVTHDGRKVAAINIPQEEPRDLLRYEFDVYCIDEVQFFSGEIQPVIKVLLYSGKTIIVSGLDMDFKGEPFGNTAFLMGIAEEVVKLQAVCTDCGENAWISAKKETGQNERVELGSDDLYYPLCRECFYDKKDGESRA